MLQISLGYIAPVHQFIISWKSISDRCADPILLFISTKCFFFLGSKMNQYLNLIQGDVYQVKLTTKNKHFFFLSNNFFSFGRFSF